MDLFIKAVAGVFIALVAYLLFANQKKEFSLLISILACCIVATGAVYYLKPVLEFFTTLKDIGQLDNGLINTVLKAVGIGILSEITSQVCADSGNAALGKTVQMLSSAVILWLSLPLLTTLVTLVDEILVNV